MVCLHTADPRVHHYAGGILQPSDCPSDIDHAVLAVRYDETAPVPFITIKVGAPLSLLCVAHRMEQLAAASAEWWQLFTSTANTPSLAAFVWDTSQTAGSAEIRRVGLLLLDSLRAWQPECQPRAAGPSSTLQPESAH